MLEVDDLQNGLLRLRPPSYVGAYFLLRIDDAAVGRAVLQRLVPLISAPSASPAGEAWLSLALSYQGLHALGVPQAVLDSFSPEFQQGMAARAAELGDVGANAPEHWEPPFGSPDVHLALSVFASGQDHFDAIMAQANQILHTLSGVTLLVRLDMHQLPTKREHFGFADGFSQPAIEGSGFPRNNPQEAPIKAGEFILGYPDEAGRLPAMPSPEVLGRNGSYLAVRKLRQDVAAFRRYLHAQASSPEEEELLAAKMIGRWRSGAPLALSPEHDDPALGADPERRNDFLYHDDDPRGYKTPPGAHIRRMNPRDSFKEEALQVNRRRILRRGGSYGPPLPEGVLDDDGVERGIVFVFVTADLKRQYEFVQSEWLNQGTFIGAPAEKDPLIGPNDGTSTFTIPKRPIRKRLQGLPQFVTVRGGEYFFAPGIRAVQWLAAGEYVREGDGATHRSDATTDQHAREDERAMAKRASTNGAGAAMKARTGTAGAAFVPYSPDVEHIDPEFAQRLESTLKQTHAYISDSVAKEGVGQAVRDAHAKGYGLVRGEVEILAGIPTEYAQGVYATPGRHEALIRFSNGSPHTGADARLGNATGMALKIFGMEGPTLLEDEPDSGTMDYANINGPVFFANTLKNYEFIQQLFVSPLPPIDLTPTQRRVGLRKYYTAFLTGLGTLPPEEWAWDELLALMTLQRIKPVNLLLSSYWTMGAVRHGDYIAKVRMAPVVSFAKKVTRRAIDLASTADAFHQALEEELRARPYEFNIQVQLCTDLERMPVDDLTVEWPEALSPFVTVAKLRLPRQDISGKKIAEAMDALSFTPWRCREEHHPLGEIQRARKEVYRQSSILRHQLNQQERKEPRNLADVFGATSLAAPVPAKAATKKHR